MSKIIVRRQEYANNGTHANEIEAVVRDNLIVNTLSSALDVAPSVGLLKSVADEIDLTGTIYTSSGSGTGSTSSFLTVATLSLPKGIYIIVGDAWWTSNANGIRILLIDTIESQANNIDNSVLGTGRSDLSKTRLLSLSETTTIYLRTYQSSGGDLLSNGKITAMRIK